MPGSRRVDFALEARINPGYAVLFRQRMEETKELPQNLGADSATDSSPVNQTILPVLCDQQRFQEAAMPLSPGISDDVANCGLLRLHPPTQKSMARLWSE